MDDRNYLTLGLMAAKLGGGVQHHHLARLIQRGKLSAQRAGRIHLLAIADLDAVREVCRTAGYYRAPAEPVPTT